MGQKWSKMSKIEGFPHFSKTAYWISLIFCMNASLRECKNANFDPKMAKKGAKIKISKIWHILFWGPLRSSLYPKIRLFEQFGLELSHFSWFLRNQNFVSETADFRAILVRYVKYFGQIRLCPNFFWLNYAKFTGTNIKTPFNISKPLSSRKKVKNDTKIVEKTLKLQ